MEYFNSTLKRRKTRQVTVGNVRIGSDAPITVQSMTNTETSNLEATLQQVGALENAGADLIRVSCPDKESTKALKYIVQKTKVPIIADIHFHSQRAIEAAEAGASRLRINPGNIGKLEKIKDVVDAAKKNNCAIRIGVNAGSLEKELIEKYYRATPEAMLESALTHIKILENLNFYNTKVSVKASNVQLAINSYKLLAMKTNYPLHLGVTEAGGLLTGSIKSSIGIGQLLMEGIGDTIRVSLSSDPVDEIKAGFEILKSLGIRSRGVKIISCPSCARQAFQVIDTVKILEEKLSHIKTPITLSIIGCVVNGPGEAALTDIGITGGGKGNNMLYLSGVQTEKVLTSEIINKVVSEVEKKAAEIENK